MAGAFALLQPGGTVMTAALFSVLLFVVDGQAAPPPAAEAPPPAAAAPAEAPQKSAPPVPWKLITKVTSVVAYGAWVGLWTLAVPVGSLGVVLVGLSQGSGDPAPGAGGAVLMVAAAVLGLLGLGAVGAGVGFGVATTVFQLLAPDTEAADATLTMFLPRTILL